MGVNHHLSRVDALKSANHTAAGGPFVKTGLITEKPQSSAGCLAFLTAWQYLMVNLAKEQDPFTWMIFVAMAQKQAFLIVHIMDGGKETVQSILMTMQELYAPLGEVSASLFWNKV